MISFCKNTELKLQMRLTINKGEFANDNVIKY